MTVAPIPVPAADVIARAESSLAFAVGRKFVKAALMTEDLDALISIAKSALLTATPSDQQPPTTRLS